MIKSVVGWVEKVGGWPYVVALFGLVLVVALVAGGWVLRAAFDGLQDAAYWVAAIGASVFYGFGSLAVWRQPEPNSESRGPVWPWRVHKWWFNGVGAFAGFYAAHLLFEHLGKQRDFSMGVFALGLVALLGMGGWLPYAVVGIAQALGELAKKAGDAVGK